MTSNQNLRLQASVMRSMPANFPPDSTMPFALYQGQIVSRGQFWRDVAAVAAQLPDRPYAFNLCENRYLFCVCLLAVVTRQQICLLPPGCQAAVIGEIAEDYAGAYVLSESADCVAGLMSLQPRVAEKAEAAVEIIDFDWQRIALIAFTSGSTGRPKPCIHNLATFKTSAEMALSSLGWQQKSYLMVSTAPPQHMYGLETSVFWPLFSNLLLCDGRPFHAEDVRRLVQGAPCPVLLASTPAHLRVLTAAEGDWSRLAGIVSATDHLTPELARNLYESLGKSVREIYGSTETLSFASRETLYESSWLVYSGCRLVAVDNGVVLESAHLPVSTALQDLIEIQEHGRFFVLGRQGDMVKIAGKRASLSELNRRLRNLPGVEDGIFYVQASGRLGVVVVGNLSKQAIRDGLQPYFDDVFLPRKIHFVAELPRSATGKLLKADIEDLLEKLL